MTENPSLPLPTLCICAQSARPGLKVLSGVSLSTWREDDKMLRCKICAKKFGLLRRKHHCRACGDIFCRRCLGFYLVNIPEQGVDMTYTCDNCVLKNRTRITLVENVKFPFPNESHAARLRFSSSVDSLSNMTTRDCIPSTAAVSPTSFSWPIAQAISLSQSIQKFDVVVSQYCNEKFLSVCSLLVNYLDCVGGAIVLVQDQHLWVVAHKGLHSRVLHDSTFLSMCDCAIKTKCAFTMPDASQLSSLPLRDPFTFQFFGASPLFDVRESAGSALGCLVALDTRVKTAAAAYEMEVMLESLAEHVMDLLAQDENILRIYASGDFKFFAASSETFAASRSESSTCLHPSQSSYFALRNEFDIRKASIKTNVAA